MTEVSTFICGCGAEFNGRCNMVPTGWQWRGSRLLCPDCSSEPSAAPFQRLAKCPTAIRLRSGSYLDLADPDCSVIQPIDIAAGLRQARFSAQTKEFYTIAQHSLLVLQLVEPVAAQIGGPKGDALRRCALMHDAPEAFIHDVTRPLKIQLPDYRRIEARLETRLFMHFGFIWNRSRKELVKRADIQALAIEQRDLVGSSDPWPIFHQTNRENLAGVTIENVMTVEKAEAAFLDAFHRLFPNLERKAA